MTALLLLVTFCTNFQVYKYRHIHICGVIKRLRIELYYYAINIRNLKFKKSLLLSNFDQFSC